MNGWEELFMACEWYPHRPIRAMCTSFIDYLGAHASVYRSYTIHPEVEL